MTESPIHLDVPFRLRAGELAEAVRALHRRSRPVLFWVRWVVTSLVLVVTLLPIPLVLLLEVEASEDFGGILGLLVTFVGLFVAFVSPWGSSWVVAASGMLSMRGARGAQVLVSFSRGAIRAHAGTVTGEFAPGAMPVRLETKRVFVFGHEGGGLGPVIPKRIFPDAETLDAFREQAIVHPRGVATADALRAFGGGDTSEGTTYTLTVGEFYRARRLLLRRSAPFRHVLLVVLPLAAVVASLAVLVSFDVLSGSIFPPVFVALIGFVVYRTRARVAASLRPVTLRLDDVGVSVSTALDRLETTWAASPGIVEDDVLLLVLLRPDFGLVLPKRAVPPDTLDAVRARLAPYRRGRGVDA